MIRRTVALLLSASALVGNAAHAASRHVCPPSAPAHHQHHERHRQAPAHNDDCGSASALQRCTAIAGPPVTIAAGEAPAALAHLAFPDQPTGRFTAPEPPPPKA
jgi:hypothetical protein